MKFWEKRARAVPTAASAPVGEYIAPAASYVTPTPVDEYIAPAPAVHAAPAPVVVFIAPAHAVSCSAPVPVAFPLSLDASDMSLAEDVYTRSWESLPAPIVFYTGRACGAFEPGKRDADRVSGRELPAVSRDRWLFHSGIVWRPLVRGMLGGSGGMHSSFARYLQHACLLVEMLARLCGLRHLGQASCWRRFGNWQREGRVRVRMAKVLEKELGPGWL